MPLIEHQKQRYLRSPRFSSGPKGVQLHAIGWSQEVGEQIITFRLNHQGEPIEAPSVGPWSEAIHTWDPRAIAASSDIDDELRAATDQHLVSITHEDGRSTVWLTHPDGRKTHVWSAVGTAASPAIARSADGVWIAFHHDVREDTHEVDLAKWIALRFVNAAGEVFEPASAMRDRDRDLEGVEQSFEFPALMVSERGAVMLFGRGSHNFWRQDLDDSGFGTRVGLADGEWGSRGKRPTVASIENHGLLVAYRDKEGLVIHRMEMATGGAPKLKPACIDLTPEKKAKACAIRPDPAERHGLQTFFGDIQQHSAHSDGIGSADEPYLRARYHYQDDFVALTDHEAFIGKRTGPGEWEYLKGVANKHNDEGRFATLIAYEWTGRRYPGPGHKCVYFPYSEAPLISKNDVPEGKEIVRLIQEAGGFTSPHHIGWTGCDEPGHDFEGQPVWEICSCHGCYEHADHPLGQRGELTDQLVDAMLRKGHRFGFTAASDSHGLLWHHGESRKRDPFRTGLTAVQAPALTREAVFNALKNRRCYATSGAKILLDVEADGQPMGSVIESDVPVTFSVSAVGTTPLTRLELVGPDGVVAQGEVNGFEATLSTQAHAAYLYARVVQSDGEMAWSSPIFFDPV